MARCNPSAPFSFKPNEWQEWLDELARFRIATKLHKEEGDVQRLVVIYAMGGGGGGGGQQANRIFRTLTFFAPEVDTKYETW